MAQEVTRVICRNRQHQVVLGTTPDRIKAAREVCPEIQTVQLGNNCPNSLDHVNESIELKTDFLRFWSERNTKLLGGNPMTQELIDKSKDAGIKLLYCEASNSAELSRLLEMGIDFPIVDFALTEAIKTCKKQGHYPVTPFCEEHTCCPNHRGCKINMKNK
ncbi:MAG: hypothetical protein KKG09_02055 [Verrucomicrobia bacterium]|nr:hypothetical protein [Verrucomicrobiota bacterium]MBU4289839.1 hypothetical protein [Verrucomicrobiota bacterium]MBU4496777.1 hypothetical protein [Verrucomicrobiota bacterium]MCG2681412.1 hypothetical protein [Kiritimatiellia bacterium]